MSSFGAAIAVYDDNPKRQDRTGKPVDEWFGVPTHVETLGEKCPDFSDLPPYIRCIVINTSADVVPRVEKLSKSAVLCIERKKIDSNEMARDDWGEWVGYLADVAKMLDEPDAENIARWANGVVYRSIEDIVTGPVREFFHNDPERQQEVVQEAAKRVFERLLECREGFERWVYVIGKNICCDLLRRESRYETLPDNALPGAANDGEAERRRHECEWRTWDERARGAGLSEQEMDAFRRVMAGQTRWKIARALGLHQKRVNAILRGIRRNPGLAVYAAGCIELEPPRPGSRSALAVAGPGKERDHIVAASRYTEIRAVLRDGPHVVEWSDLPRVLSVVHPGCPVIVDASYLTNGRIGIDALGTFRARHPYVGIVAYGEVGELGPVKKEIGVVQVPIAKGGTNDLGAIKAALLKETDREGIERLVAELKVRMPEDLYHVLDEAVELSFTYGSVGDLAARCGEGSRRLRGMMKRHGVWNPKRLLTLLVVFQVERLAQWSGMYPGPIAAVVGVREYRKVVRRVLHMGPTEVADRGGPEFVRGVILDEADGSVQ